MRARNELLELESKCEALQQQVITLTAAHSQLTARERLLTAWCEALRLLDDYAGCQSDSAEDTAGSELQLHLLLPPDTTTTSSTAHPNSHPATRPSKGPRKETDTHASRELLSSSEGVYATIAPASDPAAFLRKLLAQPLLPAAASMTVAQVAQVSRMYWEGAIRGVCRSGSMHVASWQHVVSLSTLASWWGTAAAGSGMCQGVWDIENDPHTCSPPPIAATDMSCQGMC